MHRPAVSVKTWICVGMLILAGSKSGFHFKTLTGCNSCMYSLVIYIMPPFWMMKLTDDWASEKSSHFLFAALPKWRPLNERPPRLRRKSACSAGCVILLLNRGNRTRHLWAVVYVLCHCTWLAREVSAFLSWTWGGRMAEWFRALDFNAVTRVQIPLWPLAGVVLGKCLVQLLSHPCK